MKKYLQISAVVLLFGALVLFRQLRGSDDTPVVGNGPQFQSNTPQTAQNSTSDTSSSARPGMQHMSQHMHGSYKDGTYTGPVTDAYYGNVQVQVAISGGKITDVTFVQYPNDNRTSQYINSQAMPMLKSEALQAQSAQVDIVSGASQTSQAFQQSLSGALQQAS